MDTTNQTEKPSATTDKSAHTPGPWKAGPQGLFVVAPRNRICTLYGNRDSINEAEQEANARLIAAAPELLEACKLASVYLSESGDESDCERKAILDAAI